MRQTTEKQVVGKIGEDIAVKYLKNKGFTVIERNYLKKCGEIDIIAQKGADLHFIEVKSVSYENPPQYIGTSYAADAHRPEDNIHPQKIKRLARVIQVYLSSKYQKGEPKWTFDAITVRLNTKTRQARVKFLENLIL